jgi:hypothetical protein
MRPGVRPSSAPPKDSGTYGGTVPAVFVFVAGMLPSKVERLSKLRTASFVAACRVSPTRSQQFSRFGLMLGITCRRHNMIMAEPCDKGRAESRSGACGCRASLHVTCAAQG